MLKYILTTILVLLSIPNFAQNSNYEKGLKALDRLEFQKAFKLLKPFAEEGNPMAEFAVGLYYSNPDSNQENDSLAIHYLTKSAEKFNTKAMQVLCMFYFEKGIVKEEYKIQSLVWAEIASAYDPAFNATTTRYLMRQYLNEEQLKQVEEILTKKKEKFDKISIAAFHSLNKQSKKTNKNSEKTKIPENTYSLIGDPYRDWVYRWKMERFECDTMYYTSAIEASIINSAIDTIKQNKSYEIDHLYRGDNSKKFVITVEEQNYLIGELEKLKQHKWAENLFPFSKRLEQDEIQKTFDTTEELATEEEKYMCSIIYTFSKPIFLRNNTIALYLDQKRFRTNYTQLEFSFYKKENDRWEKIAEVYKYYESAKQ